VIIHANLVEQRDVGAAGAEPVVAGGVSAGRLVVAGLLVEAVLVGRPVIRKMPRITTSATMPPITQPL